MFDSRTNTCPYDVEYVNDDEIVPKNTTVIVSRVPAKSKGGLMGRLKNRHNMHGGSAR